MEEDDGGEEFVRPVGGVPNPSLDDCPLTPLGGYQGRIVFAMPDGDIRDEKTSDVGKLIQCDYFNCIAGQTFLADNWRDPEKGHFLRSLASIWWIRQCRAAGYWDKSRPQRGPGVWPGAPGEVVLHRGSELWSFRPGDDPEVVTIAEAMRARSSGPIYRLAPETPAPATEAAHALDGRWVRDRLDMWRFEAIGEDGLSGADIVAGWIMASLLGAAAPFRPHVLAYALAGSGKTTLIRFVHALISALAGDVIDNFTNAGLANDIGGLARPLMIDEAEASPNAFGEGPIEQALHLIRRMATGTGATKKLGTIGGGAVTQTAVGAVFMAAVNPAKLDSADASRIAEVRLAPLSRPDALGRERLVSDTELEASIRRAGELAPALLARALQSAGRYLDDVARLKAAFAAQGRSPRSADLVAALAAGRRLLTEDEPLDELGAQSEAVYWSTLMDVRDASQSVSNPGADCLMHLFSWPSGKAINERVVPIGDLIRRVVKATLAGRQADEDSGSHAEVLNDFGLKLWRGFDADTGRQGWWLLVANTHPKLSAAFDRTPWRDWRRTLEFLGDLGPEYAGKVGKMQRFGLHRSRTYAVPLDPWLGEQIAPSSLSTPDHEDR